MSDYDLICKSDLYNDLVLVDNMVATADERLPDWAEIRMDKDRDCYAYNSAPELLLTAGVYAGHSSRFLGMGKKRWGWETFCITRTLTEEVTAVNDKTE